MKKISGLLTVLTGLFYFSAGSAQTLGVIGLEPIVEDDGASWDLCAVDPAAEGCSVEDPGALPEGSNASEQGRENGARGRTRASEAHDANEAR